MADAAAKPIYAEPLITPEKFNKIIIEINKALDYYERVKGLNSDRFKYDVSYFQNYTIKSKTSDAVIEHFAKIDINDGKEENKPALISFMNLLKNKDRGSFYRALIGRIDTIGLLNPITAGGRRRYRKQTKRSHTRRHKKSRKHRQRA